MKIVKDRDEYIQNLKTLIPQNSKSMEIGVWLGAFSKQILDNLNPEKLYLMDPFETMADPVTKLEYYPNFQHGTVYSNQNCYDVVSSMFEKEIQNGTVIIDRNLSTDAVNNYEDETFDFIYIDACHLYESVLWDMEHYMPKLKKGGFLGGHDYFNHHSFGVIKAVNEFCEKYNYEIILLVEESGLGDWLLSPKK